MNIDTTVKYVKRACIVVSIFALALWVMLWIGHEKRVQCTIISGEVKKTTTKDGAKSTTCSTPHLMVQYIANQQSYTSPASDSPISAAGACLNDEDAKSFASKYPINSMQTCWYNPQTPMDIHFNKTTYKPLADLCMKIIFACVVIIIIINLARRKKSNV